MRRITLKDARVSSLPINIGLNANDFSRVAAAVNEAQERLITDPLTPDEGWWGGYGRMRFTVSVASQGAYITTPQDVARILAFTVCQHPVRLRNGFFEFMEYGQGLQPNRCNTSGGCVVSAGQQTQAYERDNVVTLTEFPATPQQIAVYPTDNADVGKAVLLAGLDTNLKPVYSNTLSGAPELGEWVTLAAPFALSANTFSSLTGIQKPVTQGPVTLMAVDSTTAVQVALSSMEPGETAANYRRYFLNGLPSNCCNTAQGSVQVDAQVRFEYQPAQQDSDYLIIQSVPALIEECMAIRKGRMDNPAAQQDALKHHAKAISILNGQLDHYLGKTTTAIKMPLFPSPLRPQPI